VLEDRAQLRLAPSQRALDLPRALGLDGDPGEVRRGGDPAALFRAWSARLTVVHREGAEHVALDRENRGRPARAKIMLQRKLTPVAPIGVGRDIVDLDDLAAVG